MVKKGLLLVNLGTPNSPSLEDVRRYLAQFLNDSRVIPLPRWLRLCLLYFYILPFRAKRSAKAYSKIWTNRGSPLLFHSQDLVAALQKELSHHYIVTLGMRYGKPSITDALKELSQCESISILPLYPQYASASTGSSLELIFDQIHQQAYIPSIKIIHAFYDNPYYIHAQASIILPYLAEHDFVLFSYHGIPVNQLSCQHPCDSACGFQKNLRCYRSQCYDTSDLLARSLHLLPTQYSTAFQSRFGRTPWIKPYTDELLVELAKRGIKKLLVVCPAFTADCLETLEEIGIQAKVQWLELGAETLTLVPSLNANEVWVNAIINIMQIHTS